MVLFWLLWVSLLLGGVTALAAEFAARQGLWPRAARLPVRAHRAARPRHAEDAWLRECRGRLLPPPRVATRPGSPPGSPPTGRVT